MKGKEKKDKGAKMVLPGWFASYADMVTVMMVFFILLFTMSQVDEARFEELLAGFRGDRIGAGGGDSIFADQGIFPQPLPPIVIEEPPPEYTIDGYTPTEPPPAPTEAEIAAEMANAFRTYLAPYLQVPQPGDPAAEGEGEIVIDMAYDFSYMRLVMYRNTHFQSAQSVLLPAALEVLDLIGPLLREFAEDGHLIVIEGHADTIPLAAGNVHIDNLGLSQARAAAVFRYLRDAHGVPPEMMQPVGMGDLFPLVEGDTPEVHAMNRRVEIRIYTEVRPETHTRPTPGTGFTIPGL